jgi:hypothetical protein
MALQSNQHLRLDTGPYVRWIWFGLVLTGIHVLVTPEDASVASLPNWFDNLLGFAIMVGAGLCLYGTYRPDWRVAYRWEIGGLALIIVTLGVLAVATDLTFAEQFTINGGFGAEIQIASIVLAANLWRALRRDRLNVL